MGYIKEKLTKEIQEVDNHFKKQCDIKDTQSYSIDHYYDNKQKYDSFAEKTANLRTYKLKQQELARLEKE